MFKKNSNSTKLCNSCLVNLKRFNIKFKAVQYKGGKCFSCGYNKCISALQFHHRNPEEKSFNISGAHARKWNIIQKELDKCDLLCANCHIELHTEIYNKKQFNKKQKYIEILESRLNKVSVLKTLSCKGCKKEFKQHWKNQIFCSLQCNKINIRKVERPTKEQLLKEIEESSYVAVGKKYGVSDNAIRKWLKHY